MKNRAVSDLIFYLILPYGIWHLGKGRADDYVLIILTTVPGILYTLYTLLQARRFNFTGLFVLGTLLVSSIIDLAAGSLRNLFFYGGAYSMFMALLFLGSALLRRPLTLYFFLDVAELQGHSREDSRRLFAHPRLMQILYGITGLEAAQRLILCAAKFYVALYCYNPQARELTIGYDHFLLYQRLLGWGFGGLQLLLVAVFLRRIHGILKGMGIEPPAV
ncbi:VC0807 family protein [Gorillibacterium sp. sgz5001074]|uniref:VC0807 family protein n=1 Tax=Gorillibacterium sp. sgz5001074 TaxID=3446695 RepID=UPI003F665FE0